MKIELDPEGFNELRMCRNGPMLYNKNDAFIGGSLRKYGEWSWYEQELFGQILKPGDAVVEAGANIGAHTVALSRLVGAEGAVFAFEPQRLVFQALCANLALNQCTNVWAYPDALGAQPGSVRVPFYDPTRLANFGAVGLGDSEHGEPVRVITIDALELPACHLLKADVEGMETDVLRGAARTIARYRPVLYVENEREESSDLIGLIMGFGYQLYWHVPPLYNPANFAGDAEDIFADIFSANMLCFPAEAAASVSGMRRIESTAEKWKI